MTESASITCHGGHSRAGEPDIGAGVGARRVSGRRGGAAGRGLRAAGRRRAADGRGHRQREHAHWLDNVWTCPPGK